MKEWKCNSCGHERITENDIVMVICRFCSEEMDLIKEVKDGRLSS